MSIQTTQDIAQWQGPESMGYERTTITINGGDVHSDTLASSTRYATTINEIWKE